MNKAIKQKSKKTITTATVLTVAFLFFCFIALLLILFAATPVFAQETGLKPPALQINIPTLDTSSWTKENSGDWLAIYIAAIYKYAVGIIGIISAVIMMFGGFLWLTAGGDSGKVTNAKEWLKASLTGLIIALSSYTMLSMINPELVSFRSLDIEKIKATQNNANQTNNDEADPNLTEPNIPSGTTGVRLDNDTATRLLNDDISVKPGASLNNIQRTTILGLNTFQESFNRSIVITSGTDGDHKNGTLSHAEGYKVDLRTRDNTELITFVQNNGRQAGSVNGNPAYFMDIGGYHYRVLVESNHLDVRIEP